MKSKLTYRGPLPLYISYYVLLGLALCLVALSFRMEGNELFFQMLLAGVVAAVVSLSLIFYATKIERIIDPSLWRKNAETYYNDEGIFDYTHNGFHVITKDGKTLNILWKDIMKIDSHEDKRNPYVKVSCIDLYFSEKDFLTVDSSMPGFTLFEKRLKENMRSIWKKETADFSEETAEKQRAKLS